VHLLLTTPQDRRGEAMRIEHGDEQSETPAHDESRRAIIKRALVVAPLLMTLAARPALAKAHAGSLGMYQYGTNGDEPFPDPGDDDLFPDPWDERGGRRRGRAGGDRGSRR